MTSRLEPLHYLLCKTGKAGCDVTCTHQYLTEEEVKAQLGWYAYDPATQKVVPKDVVEIKTLYAIEPGKTYAVKFPADTPYSVFEGAKESFFGNTGAHLFIFVGDFEFLGEKP